MNMWPVIDMTATGRNIVRLRKQAGLTVRDLQNAFGFSNPQAIYKWQRGQALPTLDNLVILAAVFGVTISDIITRAALLIENQQSARTFSSICQVFFHIFLKKYPVPLFGYEVFFPVILTE